MHPYADSLAIGAIVCFAVAVAGLLFVILVGRDSSKQLRLVGGTLVAAPLGPGLAALAGAMRQPLWMVTLCGMVGCLLACVAITAALLLLPDRSRRDGGWRRDLLDGLLAGDGVFSWCWVVLLMNHFGLLQLGSARSTIGAALALFCLASTVGFVAAGRAHRPVGRIHAVATALALTSLSGLLLVVALVRDWPGHLVLVALIPTAIASVLMASTVMFPRPAERPDQTWPLAPFGAAPAFLGVASICLTATLQAFRIRGLDLGIAVVGIPMAILLGLRISLALLEARRSATRLKEREAEYWQMANIDPLTGLSNRRRLRQALEDHHDPCTLLVFDLDGFKDINDLNGHDIGDAVLVEVGQRVQAIIRTEDLAVRLGGDEFAVLIVGGSRDVRNSAELLLTALCLPYEVGDGTVHLSASIGFAASSTAADSAGMMRNADLALRIAKQRGKHRVEEFDIIYDRSLQRRLTIEHDVRGSGKRDELTLVYQPVVALPSGRLVGVEALLRWQHPVLGLISPAEFVPIAEEVGLIGELGTWVTEHACRQLAVWRAGGHDFWLAVNVSPLELRAPRYLAQLCQTLQDNAIPPDQVVLELTETAVAQDGDDLAGTLRAVRATGIRIALDDFGSGYSSLGQLSRLQVDILKIDRDLVVQPARTPTLPTATLVDVVVSLGHRLGLDVIAEGVENSAQRDVVQLAGCTLCQGYFFAEPMPADCIAEMLGADGTRRNMPNMAHAAG